MAKQHPVVVGGRYGMTASIVEKKLSAIGTLLTQERDEFSSPNFVGPTVRLLAALRDLSEVQDAKSPFHVVDCELPWEVRSKRLLDWLGTHPDFTSVPLRLVADLGVTEGSCGLVASAPIAKGSDVFFVPADCMLSTETAACSIELGPLLDDPRTNLAALPNILLTLLLMTEHSKALQAEAAAADTAAEGVAAAAAPPPPVQTLGSLAAARAAWEKVTYGSDANTAGVDDCLVESCDGGLHPVAAAPSCGHAHDGSDHGHSHHREEAHAHSHGPRRVFSPTTPLRCTQLMTETHPWGSQFRAYLAVLPGLDDVRSCLTMGEAELAAMVGTPLGPQLAESIRDTAKAYISLASMFLHANAIDGFADYYTWSHFKWAMSVLMSRQNRLPYIRPDVWPPGVRRFGAESPFHLTLIPLYDMVNHAAGEISSYFLGDCMKLEAGHAFAAGQQIVMSYGARSNDQLLKYQGFVDPGNAQDVSTVSASLSALVQGCKGSLETDPLFRIRVNLLNTLSVTPEHNGGRALRTASLMARFQAAHRDGSREALARWDATMWSVPLAFLVRLPQGPAAAAASAAEDEDDNDGVLVREGGISHDLLSFLRVAAISQKAEAATALKLMDASRRVVLGELEARAAAKEERRRLAAAADKEADEDDGFEDDESDLPPMAIARISEANEAAMLASLQGVLEAALAAIVAGGRGGSVSWRALPPESAVVVYRGLQMRLLQGALDVVTRVRARQRGRMGDMERAVADAAAALAEGDAAAAAAGAPGPGANLK